MKKSVLCAGVGLVFAALLQLGAGLELETQSVYYGLALTAAGRTNRSSCEKELTAIYRGIQVQKRWAIKLMDASGSPTSGLYWGNTYWLGSRRQCLAAASSKRVPVSRTAGPYTVETSETLPPFAIQYYAAYFTHNSNMQVFVHWENEVMITLGLCLPSSCTESEVSELLQEYFDSHTLYHQHIYNMTLKMEGVKKTEDDYSWADTGFFKIFITFLGTMLVLTILGTTYEMTSNKSNVNESKENLKTESSQLNDEVAHKKIYDDQFYNPNVFNGDKVNVKSEPEKTFTSKFWHCFSIYSNAKSILNTNVNHDGQNMLPIFGLRSLTTFWIVINHGVLYMADFFHNRTGAYYISDHLIIQAFSNSSFTVDTFVCISGFLLGYGFLKLEKKKKDAGIKDSIGKKMALVFIGIIYRILRLMPPYLTALGFAYTTSAIRHRLTAFWSSERNDINCISFWWRNMLFINNLYPKAEMCMSWSWYLSVDMQNFLIAMLLLVLATVYRKAVIYAFVGIFILANAYTGYVAYSIDFIPFVDNFLLKFDYVYGQPWTRTGPYLIGLAGGCMFHHYDGKLPFNKAIKGILWILGTTLGIVTMFGFADKDMSLISSALYMGLSRSAWALSTSWVMLACLSGNGGFINKFLSMKLWLPLGRMTYCVYLINPIVIRTFGSYTDQTWEVGVPTAIVNGMGYVMLNFIIAFAFSIIFEAPFLKLTRLLLGEKKHKHITVDPNENERLDKTVNNNVDIKKNL